MLLGSLSSSQQVAWTINKSYTVQTLLLRWSGCRADLQVSQVYYWTASWTCSEYLAVERSAPQAPWGGPGAAIQWSSFSPLNAYTVIGVYPMIIRNSMCFFCASALALTKKSDLSRQPESETWSENWKFARQKRKDLAENKLKKIKAVVSKETRFVFFFKQYDLVERKIITFGLLESSGCCRELFDTFSGRTPLLSCAFASKIYVNRSVTHIINHPGGRKILHLREL